MNPPRTGATPEPLTKQPRRDKTLFQRRELLDHVGPFADQATAQAAIDAWVHGYNHSRPHQALDMAVHAVVFRPTADEPQEDRHEVHLPDLQDETTHATTELLAPQLPALLPSPRLPVDESHIRAVEFEALISPITHPPPCTRRTRFRPTQVLAPAAKSRCSTNRLSRIVHAVHTLLICTGTG